ncbi:AAA family ATPase, partial [bacterium]|nr:AAA family ATPase [bacterium]
MTCDNLTIMVGANGTGKSCMIKALEFFFKTDITHDEQDFYNTDVTEPIRISITFHQLTQNELDLFNSYLDGNTLSIVKEISYPLSRTSQRYYGSRLYNSDFDEFRSESGQGLRRAYEALRELTEYEELPSYRNRDLAESNLSQWEREHPEQCEMRRDDGQFFGFRNVGKARMERFTKF